MEGAARPSALQGNPQAFCCLSGFLFGFQLSFGNIIPSRWEKGKEVTMRLCPQNAKKLSSLNVDKANFFQNSPAIYWFAGQKTCCVVGYELQQSSGRKMELLTALMFKVCRVNYLRQASAHSLEKWRKVFVH